MSILYVACLYCDQVNRVDSMKISSVQPTCGKCKKYLPAHENYVETSATGLQKLIKSCPKPIVCDFWSPLCQPCKAFAPVFDQVSAQLSDRINFVKCNTEDFQFAAQVFGIHSIPTLAFFARGRELNRISGALPPEQFVAWIQHSLAG